MIYVRLSRDSIKFKPPFFQRFVTTETNKRISDDRYKWKHGIVNGI